MNVPMYLCAYLPNFPMQAMLRLRPQIEGRQVIVLGGEPPLDTVVSANDMARKSGVAEGMTKADLEGFADLAVLRRSVAEERSAKAAVMEMAAVLTPRVEDHSTEIDCIIVLDITGTKLLFGPLEGIAERVVTSLRALGLTARVAASANLPTAVCLARSSAVWESVTVVEAGAEACALGPLPVGALGLTVSQAETFSLWGLRTIADLATLPEIDLVARLGGEGQRLHAFARGEARHLMVPLEQSFVLEEVMEFDQQVDGMESLLFVMGPMLDGLIMRAAHRALELASVTVSMDLDGGASHARTIRPALPMADRALLLKLLHLDLVAHPPGAGVRRLHLTAVAGGRSKVQAGLFSPQAPEPMRLEVTLARIASLVGEGRVGRPVLLDSHRPEGFHMELFTIPGTRRNVTGSEHLEARCPVALRRMRPPVPVRVQSDGSAIVEFSMQGKRYRVREQFGPWRRSGAWWSGEIWSREEWDVVTEMSDGARNMVCVLAHDLLRRRWQMEAIYD